MFDEMSLMVMTHISQSVPAVTLMKQLELKNNLHLTTTNSILCIFSRKHSSYSKSVYIYIFIIAAMGQYLANSPDLNPGDSCWLCNMQGFLWFPSTLTGSSSCASLLRASVLWNKGFGPSSVNWATSPHLAFLIPSAKYAPQQWASLC